MVDDLAVNEDAVVGDESNLGFRVLGVGFGCGGLPKLRKVGRFQGRSGRRQIVGRRRMEKDGMARHREREAGRG
jgi:hypothetical protein